MLVLPDLGATVLEKLQKLRDHHVERAVQHVTVQDLCRVLTDLLQSSKSPLKDKHSRNGTDTNHIFPLHTEQPQISYLKQFHYNQSNCPNQQWTSDTETFSWQTVHFYFWHDVEPVLLKIKYNTFAVASSSLLAHGLCILKVTCRFNAMQTAKITCRFI